MSASVSSLARRRASTPAWAPGGILLALLFCVPLAALMSWPRVLEVWQTGSFYDSDDALRIVEVRDWLAGQGWYDLVAYRLAPPAGLLMHWSRVVDVPLGLLIRLFGLFADPIHAERLARLVFPCALQVAMIAATAFVARIVAGPAAVLPAALLIVLSGISYGQFQPGRVDHHAPQILLLMLATGTTLRGLEARHAGVAALTGLLIALSLAISLENLPFFAVLLAVPPFAWLVVGPSARNTLLWFGLGLGLAVPLLMAFTVAPERLLTAVPDALSSAQASAILLGIAGLLALYGLSPRLRGVPQRSVAATIVGAAILGLVLLLDPMALHGPYAAMDPLIERLWLANVQEAQPLGKVLSDHPELMPILLGPALAGLVATLAAVRRTSSEARGRWLVVTALVLVGFAGTFWEFRVAGSVAPLALLAGAWIVAQTLAVARRSRPLALMLPLGGLLTFSATAWAFVPTPLATESQAADFATAALCRDAASWRALDDLPAVTAFAPIDAGSYILAHTRMAAIGAPYHRNQAGNLLILRAFMAKADAAEGLVRGSGAKVMLVCPGNPQLKVAATAAPDGLAADLLAGRIPAWLTPLTVPGTPYRVYAIGGAP